MSIPGYLEMASRSATAEAMHLADGWAECYSRLSRDSLPAHCHRDADIDIILRVVERENAEGREGNPSVEHVFILTRYWLLSTIEFLRHLLEAKKANDALRFLIENTETFLTIIRQESTARNPLVADPVSGSLGYCTSSIPTIVIYRRALADRLLHLAL